MNKTISKYIRDNIKYPLLIEEAPADDLGMIIVIPCYDEPDVVGSIRAIADCDKPPCAVEVIVVINASSEDSSLVHQQNEESYRAIHEMEDLPDWLRVFAIMNNNFSPKKAGVGLARKIGLDDAVRRFCSQGKEDGLLVCFDADSRCRADYLTAIYAGFGDDEYDSMGIDYHHPLDGVDFSNDVYRYITQYELHLRYFIDIQKAIGLPYAYHTVGSSMACNVKAYCSVGGMNQRKAGEDFYFMHKLIKFGRHVELDGTLVYPSPRMSHRVPFGTGRAVADLLASENDHYFTYAPESFCDLKVLVDRLPEIYNHRCYPSDLPVVLHAYLNSIDGDRQLENIISNTTDWASFAKRFWHWFDAFHLMKYLHAARDSTYPNIPVVLLGEKIFGLPLSCRDMLERYRAGFSIGHDHSLFDNEHTRRVT